MTRSISARIQILFALAYLRHGERDIAYEQLSLALVDANDKGDQVASNLITNLLGKLVS